MIKYNRYYFIGSYGTKTIEISEKITCYTEDEIVNNYDISKHILLKYLGSSDEDMSSSAAIMLKWVHAAEGVEYLRLLTDSKYDHVKHSAAYLLEQSPSTQSIIRDVLEDRTAEIRVKKACAMVISNTGDDRTIRILVRMLKDPDPEIRAHSVFLLGDDSKYCKFLKTIMFDKDPQVRSSFLPILFRFDPKLFYPDALDLLNEQKFGYVLIFLNRIEPVIDKRAIPHLEKLVRTTKDAEIRSRANNMLIKLRRKGHSRGYGKK